MRVGEIIKKNYQCQQQQQQQNGINCNLLLDKHFCNTFSTFLFRNLMALNIENTELNRVCREERKRINALFFIKKQKI